MLYLPMLLLAALLGPLCTQASHLQVSCDILIAGGSTSALAAAFGAAEASPTASICITEPTDWLGGQMSSSGVSAIDFGTYNRNTVNQPLSFQLITEAIINSQCWVSTRCYLANWFAEEWVPSHLGGHPNVRVFFRTVTTGVTRDPHTGAIVAIQSVQRTPLDPDNEWAVLLSQDLPDWYSPNDSDRFSKQQINFTAPVFIEAEEFGDVLVIGNMSVAQGAETPVENSTAYESTCGQAITIPFFMSYNTQAQPTKPPPPGNNESLPYTLGSLTWEKIWTYRRAFTPLNNTNFNATDGDVSQQNIAGGNDYDSGYIFLDLEEAKQTAAAGAWVGGINLSSLTNAEQRAYGWYWYFKNNSDPAIQPYLSLNYTTPGTLHGLAKMPYLRDTRRSVGLDGFRLFYPYLDDIVNGTHLNGSTGYRFEDTVAIGDYPVDIHPLNAAVCTLPSYYFEEHPMLAYYIPFRALTNQDVPNLLVAGKNIAESFLANAPTRLHPSEWTTGLAAGAAAVLMWQKSWSTADMLDNIEVLQDLLQTPGIRQPLEWNFGAE